MNQILKFHLRKPHGEGFILFLKRIVSKTAERIKRSITTSKNRTPGGFPLDAWSEGGYSAWFSRHKASEAELDRQRAALFDYQPTFSIVVPLFNTPIGFLHDVISSVLAQTYEKFELILVNGSPEIEDISSCIRSFQGADNRVRVVTLEKNLGITENTNAGVEVATGDFICYLDHDDTLSPDALHEYASALNDDNNIDLLYCDEDLVDISGKHVHPLFKPALSPELLLSKNYIVHMMAVRRDVLTKIPRPGSVFDGAQDFNMALCVIEHARKVHHVPKVLYHWRMSAVSTAANPHAKLYAKRAYRLSIANHLERTNTNASIYSSGLINIYNPWFSDHNGPTVSVVVDMRGHEAEIDRFLEFFSQTNSYCDTEIVIAALKPAEATSCDYGHPVRSVQVNNEGTIFSCFNQCAKNCQGDFLLFMTNDCVFATAEPLEQLVGLCQREGIGAVAPKTQYIDTTTRCYGIAVTPECIMPLHHGYPDDHPGYQCNIRALQNFSAISYRGMITPRQLFEKLGGFDASFESEIGSVDYCHRARLAGRRIVQTPTAKLITLEAFPGHRYSKEAVSTDFSADDLVLFDKKWPGARTEGDPYFNPNLDQTSCWYQLPQNR